MNQSKLKILRLKQVLDILGICKTSLYNLIESNKFPKQIRITERTVGWLESDIREWIEERKEEL